MTIIRAETPHDQIAIRALLSAAFGGDDEARLADRLREQGDLLLSLIAEDEGKLVGHIAFSPMTVIADGQTVSAAGLAPLSVAPSMQGRGTGRDLVEAGLAALLAQQIRIVFVLGDAGYYSRFGFSANQAAAFSSPYAGPHFMALRLDPSLPLPQSGRADYAPAFAELG